VIRTTGRPGDPNLYGRIRVTPLEAEEGARKLVNIPWGAQRRLFNVRVPEGVGEGRVLRLSGLGRRQADGQAGDLLLDVKIEPEGSSSP
jgi:hypothetical protein